MKMNKQTPIGWYGEALDAILDRKLPKNAPIGYDTEALRKVLG